jgi:hypothetical protein
MPSRGGAAEKYGDEENETESRRGIQGPVVGFKSDKAVLELADPFGVHPTQITEWSQKPRVQRYGLKPDAPDLQVLRAKIGQLTREHDCLKRRSSRRDG